MTVDECKYTLKNCKILGSDSLYDNLETEMNTISTCYELDHWQFACTCLLVIEELVDKVNKALAGHTFIGGNGKPVGIVLKISLISGSIITEDSQTLFFTFDGNGGGTDLTVTSKVLFSSEEELLNYLLNECIFATKINQYSKQGHKEFRKTATLKDTFKFIVDTYKLV